MSNKILPAVLLCAACATPATTDAKVAPAVACCDPGCCTDGAPPTGCCPDDCCGPNAGGAGAAATDTAPR